MSSLPALLTSEQKKTEVIDDCLKVVDEEVAEKKGVSGMAIKAGYRTVNSIRPGFLRGAVDDLLPDFAEALDPIYQEAVSRGEQVRNYLEQNAGRVADSLLAITDAKSEKAKTQIVRTTYNKLRSTAKRHVEAAIPRVGQLVEKHARS